MLLEHKSVRKNLILSACFCWDSRLFYVRWTKFLNLVDTLNMGTRSWSFYFVISKYLNYTQYCMMLLEQCEHIVVKDLVDVTKLDED